MGLKDSTIMPVIAVDDLDRAITFYRDKLGFNVRQLEQDPTSALVEVGSSDRLLLYKSSYKRGETTVASFLVDDVPGAVRDLRDKGITFEDYDLPGLKTVDGVATLGDLQSAWFKDSEGNTIAVTTEVSEVMRRAA